MTVHLDVTRLAGDVNVSITAPAGNETLRLNLRVSDEGIILDHFDDDGNCVGTIGDDFDGWAHRIDNAQAQTSEVDHVLSSRRCKLEECPHSHLGEHYHPLTSLEAYTGAFIAGVRLGAGR